MAVNKDKGIITLPTAIPLVVIPRGETDQIDNEFDSDEDHNGPNEEFLDNQMRSDAPLEKTRTKASFSCNYGGILLALLSSLIFSLSALLVKKLDSYGPFNSALYSFQGTLLAVIPLITQKYTCRKNEPNMRRKFPALIKNKNKWDLGLLLLRSFLTCNSFLVHFISLKYLSMSDAITVTASTPLFVNVLAKVFLGENCGSSIIIASIVSLFGVVAICKPPFIFGAEQFNVDFMIGTGLAFACTLFSATALITLRYIRKVHYAVTILMYGLWGTIEILVIVAIVPSLRLIIPSTGYEWSLIAALATLTLFGQTAMTLATKAEKAGPIALVRTSDVLFAFVFDMAILNVFPDFWSLIGAFLILASVIFVGVWKHVK